MIRTLLCLLCLVFLPVVGFAEAKAKPAVKSKLEPSFFYYTRGNSRGVQSALPKGANYKVYSRKDQIAEERRRGFLRSSERNALFRKIGIDTKTARMDEMDKDMLLLSAREYTLGELRSDYPMFTEKQLRDLQIEARKIK